jgi:predicted small secreted protein
MQLYGQANTLRGVKDMNKTLLTCLALPVIAFAVAGCGSTKSTGPDKAAIQQFIKDVQPHATAINKTFTDESNLVTQMSLKKISYSTFKKSYDDKEASLKTEVKSLSAVPVTDGAKAYRDEYVTLLNQGVSLMQDQENAMRTDGTTDPTKAPKVKDELNQFVTKYKELSARYGVQ